MGADVLGVKCREKTPSVQQVMLVAVLSAVLVSGPRDLASADVAAQQHGRAGAPCGWIGVRLSPMTEAVADSLGMTEPYGAIFDRPEVGGPAANAGISAGDVVTAINDTPLMNSHDFAPTIAALAPGTSVYFRSSRNREPIEFRLTVGTGSCAPEHLP
jgi:S1-C subfamily serine protease